MLDYMERSMQSGTGTVWKFDWNFQLHKMVRTDGAEATFECQFAVLNEYNEVRPPLCKNPNPLASPDVCPLPG